MARIHLHPGVSALSGRLDGVWIYDATTRAPYDQPLTIVVTALDRPGNEVTRTKPWVPTS